MISLILSFYKKFHTTFQKFVTLIFTVVIYCIGIGPTAIVYQINKKLRKEQLTTNWTKREENIQSDLEKMY